MSMFRSLMMANAAVDPLKVPLTLTAEEAGATIAIHTYGGLAIPGMHYRMGKSGAWTPYTVGTVLALPNVGDSCQFWNSEDRLGTEYNTSARFTLAKKVSASGNIQSLLNWRKDCPDRSFQYMFYAQRSLSDISQLLMPATSVGTYAYSNIFTECRSSVSPHLPAFTNLGDGAMAYMFMNSTITTVRVGFTSWGGNPADHYFSGWLSGVPSNGIFYKPSALPEEFGIVGVAESYGTNRIPEGWTVVNID